MFQRNLETTEFVEIVAPILDNRAWWITLADRRREKPKLRRLPHRQSKFASRYRRARPLLHSERHHTQCLQWRGKPRYRRQRAFNPNVVTARRATPDTN